MPRIKRYFPVSQDINEDEELWEFTKAFGDRAFRTWMEILRILDKTENRLRISEESVAGISRRVRQTPANLRRQVGWLLAKGWLASLEVSVDGSSSVLYSPNYWKYHDRREKNGTQTSSHSGTLLSEPTLPNHPNPSLSPFLIWWCREYEKKFKAVYHLRVGKEANIAEQLEATYRIDQLKDYAEEFFRSTEDFIVRAGFTLPVFASQVNKIAARCQAPVALVGSRKEMS